LFNEKSKIDFIGAVKIAYSLTSALLKAGYRVTSVVSKKISANKLAKKFNLPFNSNNPESLKQDVEIFFLTVPDSGALDISELKSLKKKKAHVASFQIMQTFPSIKIVDIKNCSVAINQKQNL
jgi:pyrroline-5-carboxylate reductase